MISNCVPPISLLYVKNDFFFFDKQAKSRIKKWSCKSEWLTKYSFISYSKTLDELFCLCCIFHPTGANQGQRAQKQTLSYHLTSVTKNAAIFANHGNSLFKDWFDNNVSSNEAKEIYENLELDGHFEGIALFRLPKLN